METPSTPKLDLSQVMSHPLIRSTRGHPEAEMPSQSPSSSPASPSPLSSKSSTLRKRLSIKHQTNIGLASPRPNIVLPNFSIQAYTETPRRSSSSRMIREHRLIEERHDDNVDERQQQQQWRHEDAGRSVGRAV